MLLGALEAGGTKMGCAVGTQDGEVLRSETFPTLTPEETLPVLIRWFSETGIDALGIGSFGPVDLNPSSPQSTEVPMWRMPRHWEFAPLLFIPKQLNIFPKSFR